MIHWLPVSRDQVRKYLNELLLDQLPVLSDLQVSVCRGTRVNRLPSHSCIFGAALFG